MWAQSSTSRCRRACPGRRPHTQRSSGSARKRPQGGGCGGFVATTQRAGKPTEAGARGPSRRGAGTHQAWPLQACRRGARAHRISGTMHMCGGAAADLRRGPREGPRWISLEIRTQPQFRTSSNYPTKEPGRLINCTTLRYVRSAVPWRSVWYYS